jgi:hypothetical protein
VVEERGLNSLQPGRALIDERLPGAWRGRATHARGPAGSRPPAADRRRATFAASSRPRGPSWRAPLPASQRGRLDRLGQMRDRAGLHQRLAYKQPARARLNSDMDLLAGEAGCPPTNALRRGPHPATLDLARPPVESVESDLRSMPIKPGYDRPWGLLYSSDSCQLARVSRAERGRPRLMPSLRELRKRRRPLGRRLPLVRSRP